jgi:hypothetical protein
VNGAVIQGREMPRGDAALDVDAVVIGTGAGGSVMLRELARAGLNAIALEQGEHLVARRFDEREEQMLPLLYEDGGGRMTSDMAIRVLQGRGVGGSTVHNTNLSRPLRVRDGCVPPQRQQRGPAPGLRGARLAWWPALAQSQGLRPVRLLRARVRL